MDEPYASIGLLTFKSWCYKFDKQLTNAIIMSIIKPEVEAHVIDRIRSY